VLLGTSFTAADADRAITAFVALTGLFVGILAMQLPLLAAYALSRYRAVAALAVIASVVHVGASAVALQLGSIGWLAAAASLSSLTAMALVTWLVHRRGTARALGIVARDVALVGLACAVAFGVPALAAAALGGGLWQLAAAVTGLAAFLVVVHVALPQHAAVAHRMVDPVLPARMRAATA